MRTSADLFVLTGLGAVAGGLLTIGLKRLILALVPVSGGLEVMAGFIAIASIGTAAVLGAALPFLRLWKTSPAALLRSN
jgi:predicted lysophospholipase L1 biosynthesis ABC-type transport system permease subunit